MVNLGPSKGCRECRARKLKCDEGKPQCLRCHRSKIKCTGFDPFREQREIVWKNNVSSRRVRHLAGWQISSTGKECIKPSPEFALTDPEQQAICFFFVDIQPRLLRHWTDELPSVYSHEKPSSMLSTVVAAVTSSFISLDPRNSHFKAIAISKYAKSLRLVREAADKPEIARSDTFLIAVFLLGIWEHSRSLALEPCSRLYHYHGALSVVKARSMESFQSPLSQKLLLNLRAEVVYGSINTEDPQVLNEFMLFAESVLSRKIGPTIANTYADFFTLPDLVMCIPILRAKEQKLFIGQCNSPGRLASASKLLAEARQSYDQLILWPFARRNKYPFESYPLRESMDESHPVYPRSINVFPDTTQATMFDSWRMAQVYVLTLIAKVTNMLRSSTPSEENRIRYSTEIDSAEKRVGELVDDFCCSIPYMISPGNIEAVAPYYPHGPESAYAPDEPGPDLIASMSLLKKNLVVGSSAYCIKVSQRQWLQQYLTLLSRNRVIDQEKALRLELHDKPGAGDPR